MLKKMYVLTNGQIPLIGVGGISNAHECYQKIKSGASLVQLYSALTFEGPQILEKILFDLKNDLNDLKKITLDLIQGDETNETVRTNHAERIQRIYNQDQSLEVEKIATNKSEIIDQEIIEENLSLQDNVYEIIQKALEKNSGKRKMAAKEIGISERTLYRKIKQYDLS